MCFWANSQCRIENSVEKAAVFLHPLYIIGLKIIPRDIVSSDFLPSEYLNFLITFILAHAFPLI